MEPELLPVKFLHCGNSDFGPCCSCDLDLDLMTFIYKLDPYSLELYRMCKMNFLCQGFRKLSSDRQTDRNYIPRRFVDC